MRTLPGTPLPLAQLHIEQDIIDNYRPGNGLVLVTGPTGSGKSTLLSSMIRDVVEKPDANERVYEFSAPIEYVYDDVPMPSSFVFQTEMRTHLRPRQGDADEHSIFAHAVRGALRRHPTIIMVGEARDKATIEATVTASLTGHVVYTTIHTIGVPETIARMLSEFPHGERKARAIDIMNVLRMVVTQILVPRIGGGKVSLREYMIFDAETRAAFLRRDPDEWPGIARTFMRDRLATSRTMGRHGLERLEAGEISQENYEFVTAREAYV
jgi:defect-in-organelle-trafficking protein DotB